VVIISTHVDLWNLAGARALVTGAAVRLGRESALALARAGADVVLHYRNSKSEAEATAMEIEGLGRRAWLVQGALDDGESARRVFDAACSTVGPLDILVNNASVFPNDELRDFSEADAHAVLDANAFAPLALMRAFHAQDREGVIVNLLDATIRSYDRSHFSYHLSKRLLHTITRAAALEFAPRVRVNAVAPGAVLPPPDKDAAYLAQRGEQNPLRAYGDAGHVAEAVLFLVRSTFITGQVVHVDGGQHLTGCVYD
jgi:NAD(P)-dependent dehydrogenase (short-subunit alcohol dehydrogenase family)